MKKYMLPLTLSALMLFSACSNEEPLEGTPHMTQEIVSGDVIQPEKSPEPETAGKVIAKAEEKAITEAVSDSKSAASAAESGNEADRPSETTLSNYYKVKAEKVAYGLEIARLEADFRIGKIDRKSFMQKKAELIENLLACEQEQTRQEEMLLPFFPEEDWTDSSDISAISKMIQSAELAEKQAELFQEQIKKKYSSDSDSWDEEARAQFVEEYALLIKQAEEADAQADWLEEQMERLGWDDGDDSNDRDDDFDDWDD